MAQQSRVSPLTDARDHAADMSRVERVAGWAGALIALLLVLVMLEASGGHNGYLGEWGIDLDGAGIGDMDCG